MAFVEIFGAFAAVFVAFILTYLLKHRGYLESLGIPVVKPFLIFGSPPYAWHKVLVHEHTQEMHRKLGKTWAMYDGREPTVFTIDLELVKAIMVKNFDSFSDIIDWDFPDKKITLDLSSGEQWKALRDRFYEALFRPKTFQINFHPQFCTNFYPKTININLYEYYGQ
jgi:hypothetical protein